MRKRFVAGGAGAWLLAALLLGPGAAAACGGGRPIAHTMDDAAITAHVKTVLLNDPQLDATKIDVSTANGVVTMSGTVKSQAAEQRAVQLARQVQGVRSVNSSLNVGS